MKLIDKVVLYLKMIRFSHSIFALPFAFTSAIIAAGGLPTMRQIFWIAVAMVGARSGAMGLNRLIDRKIDAENPRTKGRELPSGKIMPVEAFTFSAVSLALMVFAAYMLNPLCLRLSPVAIGVLVMYSYMKRYTWGVHFVLGLALALAPLGAWIAVRGTFDAGALLLSCAVFFWLPGFDVLYALDDIDFDRAYGIHSIPARFGIERSLVIARVLHLVSWSFLVLTGIVFHLGMVYMAGIVIVGGLFIYEHMLLKKDNLSRLAMAFFNMNGYISMTVFIATFIDRMLA